MGKKIKHFWVNNWHPLGWLRTYKHVFLLPTKTFSNLKRNLQKIIQNELIRKAVEGGWGDRDRVTRLRTRKIGLIILMCSHTIRLIATHCGVINIISSSFRFSIYTNELIICFFVWLKLFLCIYHTHKLGFGLFWFSHLEMDSSDCCCCCGGCSWLLDSLSMGGFLLNNQNNKLWIKKQSN